MPGLPIGTVTFLFTDIEGSTARWEGDHEGMAAALARHDALLRAAILDHGGHVVKTTGDGFHAAFARAPDALAAALAAQRRLAAEPWGEAGPIRVRIALHTGAAEERDGDYYGPPLNRAARLLATGHGGQVLLSEATAGLVRDALPDGVRLLDLGRHRLRDLAEPERVSQVVAPDLATDFPPLASLDARPHNLPTHPTTLLGRERELAEVRTLFGEGARLVTLTGPGGTGKTRLGLQVAADLLDDFAHGVFLVELAPISDPALVPTTIAQTLGVRDIGSRPIVDALTEHLRSRSVLLLLDNFEQVLPAASVAADLLASCPDLAMLATSREPLRLRGEHEYAIPPLALPNARQGRTAGAVSDSPAVALFVQRARAVRADFVLSDENAGAVAEVCARLDGLPLAIELAAARVRLLTPEAMARRLERRLPVLVGGARDLPARQQTLRGAIDWSHDLLDDDERRLFRRLAVFVGGWTVDAAEAVCNADGDLDTLGGLESLVSKSLVRQGADARGEPRFGMLETIREYALERLATSGEEEAVRRRHADLFLALAEEAEPHLARAEGARWLDQLETEHDNLRSALAWSAEATDRGSIMARLAGPLWQFWSMRGHISEGRRWLDLALERRADPPARMRLLKGAATLALHQDDLARSRALWEETVAVAQASGDRTTIALGLAQQGFVTRQRGEYLDAEQLSAQALAVARQLDDGLTLAICLGVLGQVALGQGQLDRARSALEESLSVSRESGVLTLTANTLQLLARVLGRQGDLDHATALAEEARAFYQQRGDRSGLSFCLGALMLLAQLQHDVERGLVLVREALPLNRSLGNRGNQATDFEVLAWLARAQGRAVRAARLLGAASALRATLGRPVHAERQTLNEAEVATARTVLGKEAFAAAWAEGRAMTLEQAVAYALEEEASTEAAGR